jgi:CRISPR-associated protein Csb2
LMPIVLEQCFPLGRFHATRWNQNPFEDRHGEWPPSPWRLLRALAARWFQYARETGDENEAARNELLEQLASQPPAFHLPAFTWRGEPSPRQYQKTEIAWTDASAAGAAYKKPRTTLVVDTFRVIPPSEPILWIWDTVELSTGQTKLLAELLKRILYFGRAEAFCRFRLRETPPRDARRHELSSSSKTESPVLVAIPGKKLNLASVLSFSDDALLKERQIPPGTEWRYVRLPQRPAVSMPPSHKPRLPTELQVVQFAVGGRVFPKQAQWVRVVERFRGSVLKHAAQNVSGGKCPSYRELTANDRDKLKLLSGKDGEGRPIKNHQHVHFFLYPDEFGNPTRLIAYRRTPFDSIGVQPFEIEAILAASRDPIFWQSRDPEWSLRLVPLPFETPVPAGCRSNGAPASVWVSATPFVPPNRRRFRRNGRLRAAETAGALLKKALADTLLLSGSSASVTDVQPIDDDGNSLILQPGYDPTQCCWVTIHETLHERRERLEGRGRRVRPGFRFRIEFSEPVCGPFLIGHSCHFGLGLLVPEERA